jgi:pimeloyl-ACP methyl ester carboxylesterase
MRFRVVSLLCCLFAVGAAADPPRRAILGHLPVPAKHIAIFGQDIVYYEAGSGRALVLLCNLGWDSNAWSQNFPELSKHYRVLAIDLLGIGKSAKPLIDYKMDTWTDVIAEFLRLKHIPKATVAGAVMGGALAVQFGLDHPELSEGIVCAASNSGPGKHEGGYAGLGGPSLAGTRQGLLHAFYDKSLVTDALVRARFASRLAAGDGYTIQRHLSDHRAPYSAQELAHINVPTLFVWCREDEITPLSWGEDYASAVPGAKLAVLDRCGHLPNIEQPKQFNDAVVGFLGAK